MVANPPPYIVRMTQKIATNRARLPVAPAVVAVILFSAWRLGRSAVTRADTALLCAAGFALTAWLRFDTALALILCGVAAFKEHCAFGFWKGSLIVPGSKEAMGQFGCITKISDLPKPVLAAAA